MKCGGCGGDNAAQETRDVESNCRGIVLLLKDVSGKYCPDCGEMTMDRTEADSYMGKLSEARTANGIPERKRP